jgi:hypothetical protein
MERLSKDQRVKKPQAILALFSICIVGVAFYHFGRSIWVPVYQQFTGRRTVDQVVALYGTAAEQRLAPFFHKAAVSCPPARIALVELK